MNRGTFKVKGYPKFKALTFPNSNGILCNWKFFIQGHVFFGSNCSDCLVQKCSSLPHSHILCNVPLRLFKSGLFFPLKSGLAWCLASTNRMWQHWCCARPLEVWSAARSLEPCPTAICHLKARLLRLEKLPGAKTSSSSWSHVIPAPSQLCSWHMHEPTWELMSLSWISLK